MLKKTVLILAAAFSGVLNAQTSSTDLMYEAQPVGGKDQLEWVLQTQLSLPKVVLATDFDYNVTVFFNVDSLGNATSPRTKSVQNNAIRNEVYRQLRFLKFRRTLNLPDEEAPYFASFRISSEKYNKYYKQKTKYTPKKVVAADSSYVVYSRADRSPDYYKNGDDGLKEFILSEMEYPKLAIEKSVEGTAVLEFIVETNGYITNVISKQNVNAGCTEEAMRIMKLTRWQPATLNGKAVRYRMTYPITFSLRLKTSNSPTGQ